MAIYPNYLPFTEDTDYEAVWITVQMMYSDILNQGDGCCKPKGVTDILDQVDGFLRDVQINTTGQPNANEIRWQNSIQQAYLLLMGFFRLSANDVSPIPVVPFPDDVVTDVERGNAYYSNLQAEYSSDLKKGCDCTPTSYTCLKRITSALDKKVALEQYDDISKGLVDKMIKIIGDFVPAAKVKGYWGFKDNTDVLGYADIIAGTPVLFEHNSYVDIPYVFTDKVPWFAIPHTEPEKNRYEDLADPDNYGEIGTDQDYMNHSVLVTGAIPMDFYGGNYITTQLTTLRFKTV